MTAATLADTLASLYASEINCGLSSFWDGNWRAWVGDETNGIRASTDDIPLDQVAEWLHKNAIAQFPDSHYAKERGA